MDKNELLGLTKAAIGNQLGRLSSVLGSSVEDTAAATELAFSILLDGARHQMSRPAEAEMLLRALDDHDGRILDGLSSQFADGNHLNLLAQGSKAAEHVLRETQENATQRLATSAKITSGNARVLLALLSPVLLGILGRQKRSEHLDAADIARIFSDSDERREAPDITKPLPPQNEGYGLATKNSTEMSDTSHRAMLGAANSEAGRSEAGNMMMAFVPLIILAALAYWAFSAFQGSEIQEPTVPATSTDQVSTP